MISEIYGLLPERLSGILTRMSREISCKISDIWIKSGSSLSVCIDGKCHNVRADGSLCEFPHGCTVFKPEVEEVFMRICDYSVYAFEDELRNGFITVRGGHRAGICGTAVYLNNQITSIKNISGINIRIARQCLGCCDKIFDKLYNEKVIKNTLIAAPPCSGKTTLLRDIARRLSISNIKTAIIDERGEIAAMYKGIPAFDLGTNCAVFDMYKKTDGILQAVRTFSPSVIILDEISTTEECKRVVECMNCGVSFIMSAHIYSAEDLKKRELVRYLNDNRAINMTVILNSSHIITDIYETDV